MKSGQASLGCNGLVRQNYMIMACQLEWQHDQLNSA